MNFATLDVAWGGNCERKTLAQSFNRSSFVTHIVGKYRLPQALQYQRCSTSSGLSCSMPSVAAGHVCALVVGKTPRPRGRRGTPSSCRWTARPCSPRHERTWTGLHPHSPKRVVRATCLQSPVSKRPVIVHGRGSKTALTRKCCPDCRLHVLFLALLDGQDEHQDIQRRFDRHFGEFPLVQARK